MGGSTRSGGEGAHRRDLEPRKSIRVVTQHGHVVTPLLSARRGASALPPVFLRRRRCSSRPRIEGVVKVEIARKNERDRDAGVRAGLLDSGGVRERAHRTQADDVEESTCFLDWLRSSRPEVPP